MSESVTPSSEPERWRPVVGYEGFYEVSDLGRVRRLRKAGPRLRKLYLGRHYLGVRLCRDGKGRNRPVHILVAEAFLGPRPEGMFVCHGPAGSLDNSLANLSYGTPAKNGGPDRYRDGTMIMGADQINAKMTDEIVQACRARAAAGETQTALAREFGVGQPTMSLTVRGINWKHVPIPDGMEVPTRSRMTDEAVRECRERYAAGEPASSIARGLGVSRQTVRNAVIGHTWKRVPFLDANSADRWRDGTNVKLTDEIVRQCRARAARGESAAFLAKEFGVSQPTMWRAVQGFTWKHVA